MTLIWGSHSSILPSLLSPLNRGTVPVAFSSPNTLVRRNAGNIKASIVGNKPEENRWELRADGLTLCHTPSGVCHS